MRKLFLLLGIGLCVSSCSILAPSLTTTGPRRAIAAADGRRLTPAEDPATGLYGYLNDLGVWAIPPRYQSASAFNDAGVACVRFGNRYGAINRMNQVVVDFNFRDWSIAQSAIQSLSKGRSQGLDLWLEQDAATGLHGFLDCRGEWFIAPQYTGGYNFNDRGFAVVAVAEGRWGAINRRGEMAVQPNFSTSGEAESALRRLTR